MAFDLDYKEFCAAVEDGNYKFIWAAYQHVQKERNEAKDFATHCPHPETRVEAIANMEFPGGVVVWCSRCGAWKDTDEGEWNLPHEERKR